MARPRSAAAVVCNVGIHQAVERAPVGSDIAGRSAQPWKNGQLGHSFSLWERFKLVFSAGDNLTCDFRECWRSARSLFGRRSSSTESSHSSHGGSWHTNQSGRRGTSLRWRRSPQPSSPHAADPHPPASTGWRKPLLVLRCRRPARGKLCLCHTMMISEGSLPGAKLCWLIYRSSGGGSHSGRRA